MSQIYKPSSGSSLPPTVVSTWFDENANFSPTGGNGYFIINPGVVATLPNFPSQGTTIAFIVDVGSTLQITATGNATILIGSALSQNNGTATSTDQGCSLVLVFRTIDNSWHTLASDGSWLVM